MFRPFQIEHFDGVSHIPLIMFWLYFSNAGRKQLKKLLFPRSVNFVGK